MKKITSRDINQLNGKIGSFVINLLTGVNTNGTYQMNTNKIADKFNITKRQVQNWMTKLIELGWVERSYRKGKDNNLYPVLTLLIEFDYEKEKSEQLALWSDTYGKNLESQELTKEEVEEIIEENVHCDIEEEKIPYPKLILKKVKISQKLNAHFKNRFGRYMYKNERMSFADLVELHSEYEVLSAIEKSKSWRQEIYAPAGFIAGVLEGTINIDTQDLKSKNNDLVIFEAPRQEPSLQGIEVNSDANSKSLSSKNDIFLKSEGDTSLEDLLKVAKEGVLRNTNQGGKV